MSKPNVNKQKNVEKVKILKSFLFIFFNLFKLTKILVLLS